MGQKLGRLFERFSHNLKGKISPPSTPTPIPKSEIPQPLSQDQIFLGGRVRTEGQDFRCDLL